MKKIKLFLASSEELKTDRNQLEIFTNGKNKDWVEQDLFLELVMWEDSLDAMSQTRLQEEYNKAIRECDIFVMLFFTKVGKYTEEEFETALDQFKKTNRPFIFTYFKDAKVTTGSMNQKDMTSRFAFEKKLKALGHFITLYRSIEDLKFKFNKQLDRLAKDFFLADLEEKSTSLKAPGARPIIEDEKVIYNSGRKEKLLKILQELDSVMRLHMESINAVVGKLRKDRNIKEAYQNFYDLVREKNFHKDYTDIRRRLRKFSKKDEKKEENLKCLKTLRNALYDFQVTAYMMTEDMPKKNYPSYQLEEAFRRALDIYNILSDENTQKTDPGRVRKLKKELGLTLNHWPWMQLQDGQQYDLETSENVSNYIEQWFIGWHEHVQMTLHGSPNHENLGFNDALSKLKNRYDL